MFNRYKMKSLLLAIMLFICCSCQSQMPDSIQFKKTSFGFVFSPGPSFRSLNYALTNKWVEDIRNAEEVAAFGFSTGVTIQHALTKNAALQTGLLYSVKGEQTKFTSLKWTTSDPHYPVKSKTEFHFQYIEIPITIAHSFGKSKLKFFSTAGVSMNMFTKKKTEVVSAFADEHKESSYSDVDAGYLKFNLAVILGMGIKYDASKRMSLYVEPVYKQFLNSIFTDDNAKEYLYSIGTNIGINYKFKRKPRRR
jgi:opacity protein-like surface antigen